MEQLEEKLSMQLEAIGLIIVGCRGAITRLINAGFSATCEEVLKIRQDLENYVAQFSLVEARLTEVENSY